MNRILRHSPSFLYILLLTFTFGFLFPTNTQGFTINPPGTVPTIAPSAPGQGVTNIVGNVIKIFFLISSIGVTIMIVWGAFEWIISGGDKEKIANARKRITTAIIGLVLLALSFFIVSLVGEVTGVPILGDLNIPWLGDRVGS